MSTTTGRSAVRPLNVVSASSRWIELAPALFGAVAFFAAALVFLVEPMITKLVLPMLGGSPAVWNTCLAFFQAALLLGYAYAHLLQRLGSAQSQIRVHGAMLLLAALFLPLNVSPVLGEPGTQNPILWLLGVLGLSIGLPFAVLSATAPLVQAWYARLRAGHPDAANPYRLYVASNLGSLIALLAYPIVIEPILSLRTQTLAWSLGYGLFVVLIGVAATIIWPMGKGLSGVVASVAPPTPIGWSDRLIWVALAAAPSSLMLGVTAHISSDIGSAPMLWVVPLALYLSTFIVAFQTKPLISHANALTFQAAAFLASLLMMGLSIELFPLQTVLELAGFFLTALICHQALAARRPPASRLTEFYLLMSLGGVIGGAFNAFLAPLLFKTVLEYPLVLVLSCLARPWRGGWPSRREGLLLVVGLAAGTATIGIGHIFGLAALTKVMLATTVAATFLLRDRTMPFIGLWGLLLLGGMALSTPQDTLATERSFFGVVRLLRTMVPHYGEARIMVHGTIMHGAELWDRTDRCRPMLYYATTTPIGQVFRSVQARKPSTRIGAIGMGAGTVAAYTRPGDSLRFFEIDPLVVRMAVDPANFSYINGCAKGRIDHVLGDARLTLAHEPDGLYDILLVDAFSSDSVPAHLLTVEAMRGYLRHITPEGVVVMHLSNNNLELMRPVAAIAGAVGAVALQQAYRQPADTIDNIDSAEDVVIVARDEAALAPFRADPRWKPADPRGVRAWTDDYTNLFGALVRGIGHTEREARE